MTACSAGRQSGALAKDVAGAVRVAHDAGLNLRLTELNSVTCGGKAGVSNTFATALWAPDALFTLMRAGVDGVNLHVRAYSINAPFSLTRRRGLQPRPLLYGLIMFARTLGADARLVRLQMSHPRSLNLSAWAVRVRGDMLHVLLIDKSNRTVRVDLHLPATGPATVERLLAPSASSTTGETLAGQRLGPDGTWVGTRIAETITAGAHGYVLTVPRRSAALVGVRIAPRVTRDIRAGTYDRPAPREGPAPGDRSPGTDSRGRATGPPGRPARLTRVAQDVSSGVGECSNCVMRRSSSTRASTSPAVSRSTRSVPNSSTLNDASAVPYAIASRTTGCVNGLSRWRAR